MPQKGRKEITVFAIPFFFELVLMSHKKQFQIPADQIQPLAEDHGSCIASDRITVDGCKVGYMYREEPEDEYDSGWRFLAGDESDEYLADVDNLGLYDVNTIANYDQDIIPHLDAPFDSAFGRDENGGELLEEEFGEE